jgi:MFS family permease
VTDKFGRRNMVCISLVVCTAALLFIGVLAFVDKSQAIKNLLMVIACVWSFASAVSMSKP